MRLVIDGTNILHIAYWTAKRVTTDFDDNREKYISFFLNIIRSYAKHFYPEETIVCWDAREEGYKNFRKENDENYKGNREFKSEIYSMQDKLEDILTSLGIRQMYPRTREADDIMYWYAKVYDPGNCVIVSSDTDMYQLVDGSSNIIYDPRKKKEIDDRFLSAKFLVNNGKDFIIRKALKGDSADNIRGVYRIRKDRIKNIIEKLTEGKTINDIVDEGILTEDESETFKKNLDLMSLDRLKDDKEEMAWYEEQASRDLEPCKDLFRQLCRELGFEKMRNEASSWVGYFNQTEETGIDLSKYALSF